MVCIDPPFAKLIRGCWFAKVVVMSERSPDRYMSRYANCSTPFIAWIRDESWQL